MSLCTGTCSSCQSCSWWSRLTEATLHILAQCVVLLQNQSLAARKCDFNLSVLAFCCLHGTAPPYLANYLQPVADIDSRQWLHSVSTMAVVVMRTRHSTTGRFVLPHCVSGTTCHTPARHRPASEDTCIFPQLPQLTYRNFIAICTVDL